MPVVTRKNHLRLVSKNNGESKKLDTPLCVESRGDLLINDGVPLLILVKEEDVLRSDEFVGLLRNISPAWLFDTRISPRLDIVAPNRLQAFNIFATLGINYVDVSGSFPLQQYNEERGIPEFSVELVLPKLMQCSASRTTFIFLFDSESSLSRTAKIMTNAIRNANLFDDFRVSRFRPQDDELLFM